MTSSDHSENKVRWGFHHIGGLNQATLQTSEELKKLSELDPKLWVALSCPIKDLQFDARTLALLDMDNDGRIRIQDITAAVNWTVQRLRDPAAITRRQEKLGLSDIRDDTTEGREILATARKILREQGAPDADGIFPAQASAAVTAAAQMPFNGDGILPPRSEFGTEMRQFITDIINTVGSVTDASGEQGVNTELVKRFFEESKAFLSWNAELQSASASLPFAENSAKAYELYHSVAAKIDDYFIRCQLVVYDPASSTAMNVPETAFTRLSEQNLTADEATLAQLPLEKIVPGQPLSLKDGLNPAWLDAIQSLREQVIFPIFGERESFSYEEWNKLKRLFAAYASIFNRQPETSVKKLGAPRLQTLVDSDTEHHFDALATQDFAARKEMESIHDIERLTLYHAHLYRFLMNFVSFSDFYTKVAPTTFQIGILYLDSRSCTLCMRVDSIEDHANLAKLSGLCLVYCTCVRKNSTEHMNIVAAVTAGNADLLVPGRHGVFVDTAGNEWDTTLTKLVANPISIREAVFSPYRRMGRAITAQIQRLSAAKDNQIVSDTSKSLENIGSEGTKTTPSPFDIGKNVGIFAAIGLALGAIGTAIASIFSALVSLAWWQLPLVVAGIFILISGPSVILAWLKLRRRTLGPVLDASGWAVNSQIPINLAMGRSLTGAVSLPPNSIRVFDDPLNKPSRRKRAAFALVVVCIAAACVFGGWMWHQGHQADATMRAAESALNTALEQWIKK